MRKNFKMKLEKNITLMIFLRIAKIGFSCQKKLSLLKICRIMKKIATLCFCAAMALTTQAQNFNDYFENKTLRTDYLFTGNAENCGDCTSSCVAARPIRMIRPPDERSDKSPFTEAQSNVPSAFFSTT